MNESSRREGEGGKKEIVVYIIYMKYGPKEEITVKGVKESN